MLYVILYPLGSAQRTLSRTGSPSLPEMTVNDGMNAGLAQPKSIASTTSPVMKSVPKFEISSDSDKPASPKGKQVSNIVADMCVCLPRVRHNGYSTMNDVAIDIIDGNIF